MMAAPASTATRDDDDELHAILRNVTRPVPSAKRWSTRRTTSSSPIRPTTSKSSRGPST